MNIEEEFKFPEIIQQKTKKDHVNLKSFKLLKIIGKGSYA